MANPEEAELARLRAEADVAQAELKAAQARAALTAAEAEAASRANATESASEASSTGADASAEKPAEVQGPGGTEVPAAGDDTVESDDSVEPDEPDVAGEGPTSPSPSATTDVPPPGPLSETEVEAIRQAHTFEAATLDVGALVNGAPLADAQVRIPLAVLNRHGLIAGATGTGKTRTLQALAEQLGFHGVPVFASDVKGDLTGMATPGEAQEKLLARTASIGQDWSPGASAVEYFALGGIGHGVPVRATISGFGPLLLSKVLQLNATQESSLGLVFHYADANGLALADLSDLRAVLSHLVSDAGKPELKELGGLSSATAGVILRKLITFADDGADVFFGEPEFDVLDFLRMAEDGRGIISLLEVPGIIDKPALFSTFLMYLLAELFERLPEVGDPERPKLVFFFDEAHLLFNGASADFLASIVQTVRLIRSKGVGIVFVTQSPKDLPADVLAQLGSRVQHAMRAFTPDDAKALRQTVSTYPHSGYDLERTLQELGTGEAIVTVLGERGAPTPVAWTMLQAPRGLMSPTPVAEIERAVAASPLLERYGTAIDPESAREILAARMAQAAEADAAEREALEQAKTEAKAEKERAAQQKADAARAKRAQADIERLAKKVSRSTRTTRRRSSSPMEELGTAAAKTLLDAVIRGTFGTGRR